jgi:predicted  nucleic acid-binding Zn-ribbon protein
VPDQPPRRRITDKDRRRWPDRALDQLAERLDDLADRQPALDRRISELRNDMLETRRESNRRFDRIEERLEECFTRNFEEHANVQRTANEIKKKVAPSRLDWALKFATIVSLIMVPILAAWVARGGP